jgi:hypothetical protein
VQWQRGSPPSGQTVLHTHTETEWSNYQTANSLGPNYPRYIAVGESTVTPPPPPDGVKP